MKPTTVIRRQLATEEVLAGEWRIVRNAKPIGRMYRARSAYGICLEIEICGRAISAARDINSALDNAAVHIWRAETAATRKETPQ